MRIATSVLDELRAEKNQGALIEMLLRAYYTDRGVTLQDRYVPERRGGVRRGNGVSFRCPMPTPGDIKAMLVFQSHYRPEHQLAKGADDKEAAEKIKNSLTKYGNWLKVAVTKRQIVGTIGVYPLQQSAINGVLDGTLTDSALLPDGNGTACYISGINILPSHRRSRRVIHGLMVQIAESIARLAPIMVYAQPATPEGKRMAIRMGFVQCAGQEDAEDPLYECFVSSAIDVWQKIAIKGG